MERYASRYRSVTLGWPSAPTRAQAYNEKVGRLALERQAENSSSAAARGREHAAQRKAERKLQDGKNQKQYVPNFSPVSATARRFAALKNGGDLDPA